MPLTPETLPRHELTGLAVTVVDAVNTDLVGITGRVLRETTNTLIVCEDEDTRQVPKRDARFRFRLPDGSTVDVDGDRLVAQPARRTEMRGASSWV